jgi:biopolymer transport protein ExbD
MRLVGPRVPVQLDAMPLVGVGLVLLVAVALLYPPETRQVPVEVPRRIDCDCETSVGQTIVVLVRADMTARVADGNDVSVVPLTDLARTVYPLLCRRRTEWVVFVDFDDEVPWGDAVSVFDTLRSVRRPEAPTLVALHRPDWRN